MILIVIITPLKSIMKTIATAVVGIALSAPLLASAYWGDGYGMMGYGYGMMDGVGFLGGFGCIVWTIVGILAAIWLWQNINKKGGGGQH